MWAGVDVGGRRKGLHAVVVDTRQVRAGPERLRRAEDAVEWLRRHSPRLVAVDGPRATAPDGSRSRPEERRLATAICGIRYTPERSLLEGNPYYEWIAVGLELYVALERAGLAAIECFPTASWTRWAGPRATATRAVWSRRALAGLGLDGVPPRLGQDGRDAIAAALTARCCDLDLSERFGEIVVPRVAG